MSSGAGMTGGLLRKAGTGPGRFTLPVVDAKTGKLETKKKVSEPMNNTADQVFLS